MFKCSLLHSESIATGISMTLEACAPKQKVKGYPRSFPKLRTESWGMGVRKRGRMAGLDRVTWDQGLGFNSKNSAEQWNLCLIYQSCFCVLFLLTYIVFVVTWHIKLQSCIWNIPLLGLERRNHSGSWFEESEALDRWWSILGGSLGSPAGRAACETPPWEWFIIAMHFPLITQQAAIIFNCRRICNDECVRRNTLPSWSNERKCCIFLGYCCSYSVGFELLPIYVIDRNQPSGMCSDADLQNIHLPH